MSHEKRGQFWNNIVAFLVFSGQAGASSIIVRGKKL